LSRLLFRSGTRRHRQPHGNTKLLEWKPIDTAPTDGSWIEVRGWDFGIVGSHRHYAIARSDNGKWTDADGNQFRHLTEWQK
jgi:hypothetical protein